jgi:hypothetical protein
MAVPKLHRSYGKHIEIQAPQNSGSLLFNYKKTFSVVLLALVDANYKFTIIDDGRYGKSSDGGLFARSILGKSLEANTLNIPNSKPPPNSEEPLPFVVVGDEAFPIKKYLLDLTREFQPGTLRASSFITIDCQGHAELFRMLSVLSLRNLGYFMAKFN